MNIAQKSVTLGLLKLTLNKLIHSHSTMRSPSLSSLKHHHCITMPALPRQTGLQSSAMTWLLSENSTAQVADAIEQTFTAC